jgi:predicted ATPase/DNA-binding XRE family transcriptional regulator
MYNPFMAASTTAISPDTFINLGELLRYLRKRAELSQRELALQVGYHYSHMSRIENSEYVPDPATLMARFVPALGLEREPAWTERLLELAASEEKTFVPKKGSKPASAEPEPFDQRFDTVSSRLGTGPSAVSASTHTLALVRLKPHSARVVPMPFREGKPDPASFAFDSMPGFFPVSLTPLLGREQEVSSVTRLLSRFDTRLVTVVGPPGIGKTRLAVQVASEAAGLFAHGLNFIDLAPVGEPTGLLPALAQGLGVNESPDMPLMARLVQALRQKNLLLVMDNFEQLIEAAPQVHQLLIGAPGIKALVTSRMPLHIAGENQFSVPPLSLPQDASKDRTDSGDQDLLGYAAIRLFVERARAVQPEFQLTPENAAAVVQVCRRLDGLPLAIELAAARVRTLSPQSMLNQIDRRFDWLARNNREGRASKQTLRGAIEWSYNLLSEKEKILFRRLSVFSSGRTVETAEAVCADAETAPHESTPSLLAGEIFDLLIQLTDKSLLYTEIDNGETRFNFMETIHEFAREKLVRAGEEAQIRNRHLAYFCRLAERVEIEIEGADQVAWADRCETERPNMRAAMEWSLREEADLQTGIRLAVNLGLFWFLHSHYIEGLYWFKIFLQKARDLPDERILAKLLFRTADLHLNRAEFDSAARLIDESVALCRKIEDKVMLASALYIRADLFLALRELEAARDTIQECIALSWEVHYPALQDVAQILLGRIYFQMGDHDSAHASLQEGLALATLLSDHWGTASGHRTLGDIFIRDGNYSEARKSFERGLEPSRIIGDKLMTGSMLTNLAVITNLQGQYAESGRFAEEAFGIFQAVGDELQQSLPLQMMGYAAIHAGNFVRARVLIRESLKGSRAIRDDAGQLASIVAFAAYILAEKDVKRAVSLCALIKRRVKVDGVKLPEPDVKALQEVLQQGKKKLSKAAYEAAYKNGTSMKLEDEIMKLMA